MIEYYDPAHDEDMRVLMRDQLRSDMLDEDLDEDLFIDPEQDEDDLAFFSSKATVGGYAHVR